MSVISSIWENLVTITHVSSEDSHLPNASQCASPLSPSLVPTCPSPPHLCPTSDLASPGVTGQLEDPNTQPILRSIIIANNSVINSDKSRLYWESIDRDKAPSLSSLHRSLHHVGKRLQEVSQVLTRPRCWPPLIRLLFPGFFLLLRVQPPQPLPELLHGAARLPCQLAANFSPT